MAVIPNAVRAVSQLAAGRESLFDCELTRHYPPLYTNCVPSASLFTVQISMIAQIQLTTAA